MTVEDEGRVAAERFREMHGLGLTPLEDLAALIDLTQGIDVAILDAEPDAHGMTMRDPDRGVSMIAVASTHNPARQRSTLAHELAHIVFGDFVTYDHTDWADRTDAEQRADTFARHLLVPLDGLKAAWRGQDESLQELSMLVQRFQASPAIVAIQAELAGCISSEVKQAWMTQTTPRLAARFGWSDQYRLWQMESSARRAPQRLLARATEGYIANVVSLETIARLRGCTPQEVLDEFDDARIYPDDEPAQWVSAPGLPDVNVDFSELDALEAQEKDG